MKLSLQLATLPLSYFSMVLGLSSLTLAWRYAASNNIIPSLFEQLLTLISIALWLVLLFGYIKKWVSHSSLAKTEFQDKILCCFASLIPITTMLIGIVLIPYLHGTAEVLIVVGTVLQLLFAAYRNAGLWRGTHHAAATTPIVYLPAVASNFVSSIAFSQLGYTALPWLFWGAAMLSWLSIEPAILQRLRNIEAIAPEKRAILGIQLAPAFVAGNAYLQMQQGQIDVILLMLVGYGLLQFFYLVRLSKWIFQAGFTMGAWAFSFGLSAMANLGLHIARQANEPIVTDIGWLMWCIGNLFIVFISVFTLRYAIRFLRASNAPS